MLHIQQVFVVDAGVNGKTSAKDAHGTRKYNVGLPVVLPIALKGVKFSRKRAMQRNLNKLTH